MRKKRPESIRRIEGTSPGKGDAHLPGFSGGSEGGPRLPGPSALAAAAAPWVPVLRFYLEEPGWWHPGGSLRATARVASCALLISLCARTMFGIINPENSFAVGLWLACTVAGGLLWVGAGVSLGVLALWLGLWWACTRRRRIWCRQVLRAAGWGEVFLSPRLLRFSDRVWSRLPPCDQFCATPWSGAWCGGTVAPVNLYAALALLEELEESGGSAAGEGDGEEPVSTAAQKVAAVVALVEGEGGGTFSEGARRIPGAGDHPVSPVWLPHTGRPEG